MKVPKQYNFAQIRGELLKALRKRRSQGRVSQLLGFTFNQVYRWESGISHIKWSDFVKYCKVCKIDLSSAMKKTLGYKNSPERADLLIQQTIGRRTLVSLARELNISRFSLQNWVNGEADPPLDNILKILQHFDTMMYFIDVLVEGEMIPCLQADHNKKQQQLKIFYDHPICSAIMMCLRLSSYLELTAHKDGLIAKNLGISIEDEKRYLRELKEAGAIEWSQKKFHAVAEHFDARGDFEREKKMRTFWVQKGLEVASRSTSPGARANFGMGMIAVSPQKEARLQEALNEFVTKAMTIAREPDDHATSLKVLCLQLFNPGD